MNLSKKIEAKRKAQKKEKTVANAKKIGVGAIVGVVGGVASGVLLAPKSGKETREDIKEVGKKVGTRVKETKEVIGDKILVRRKVEEVDLEDIVDDTIEDIKERY